MGGRERGGQSKTINDCKGKEISEEKCRFFPYCYKWKNFNSWCEIFLAGCGRKLLSSSKISEFLRYRKISLLLLWYRFKEGQMWYVLHWYQVLEPRLHLMYKYTHFTSKELTEKYNIFWQVFSRMRRQITIIFWVLLAI